MNKTMIAIIAVLLTIFVIADSADYSRGTPNFDGDGSEQSPYLIKNVNDLCYFSEYVNSGNKCNNIHFKQTSDIDLHNIEWNPIAPFGSSNEFNGTYDGGGHIIRNMVVNTTGNNGLFGVLGGIVMNLGIEDSTVSGACVGSIASHSSSINP